MNAIQPPTVTHILPAIQHILADCLGVEIEEAVPEASFFDDLGGESIDVLDLSFRCEKQFGIKPPFQQMTSADASYVDESGRFTPTARARLQSRFPWLDGNRLAATTPRGLFTVEFIARVVEQSITDGVTKTSSAS
jgi:acyl carrier protein